jgi:TolB-like protein
VRALTNFLAEVQRRQVFGVVIIYVGAAWVLLQVAESDAVQDMFRVDAQLVLLAAIVGFPLALVAGWFYDIRKDGVFRTSPVSSDESFDERLGGRDLALLGLLVIVWVTGTYLLYVPPPVDRSIAVFQFENRSHDPDSAVLAYGVRDDLNVHLGRIGQLRVIESNSVDKVDSSLPMREIGRRLGASYLLRGSFERIADRVRVNVILVDSKNESQPWADSYDRELTTENLFEIRGGIARAVADALRMNLTDQERRVIDDRPTDVLEALLAHARGRKLLEERTGPALERAVVEFTKAIELDPDFAQPHADLAITYTLLIAGPFGEGYGKLDFDEGMALAAPHVARALELGPDLAESYAAKGKHLWPTDSNEALVYLRRALELNPSIPDVLNWMHIILNQRGDFAEGFALLDEAIRNNPLSVPLNMNRVEELALRGRVDEAKIALQNLASICEWCASAHEKIWLSSGDAWANLIIGTLEHRAANDKPVQPRDDLQYQLASIGLVDEALRIANEQDPQVLMVTDRDAAAEWLAENSIGRETPGWDGWNGAYVFPWVGMYAEALPIFEENWPETELGNHFISVRWPETYIMQAIIATHRAAGDDAGAGEVLEYMFENVRRHREAGFVATFWEISVDYQEGIALYMAGERDAGLELIVKAASDGYWLSPPGKFQDAMYAEPEIVEVLEIQAGWAERERKRLLDIVCTDNPYASVWQPTEETCADHFSRPDN